MVNPIYNIIKIKFLPIFKMKNQNFFIKKEIYIFLYIIKKTYIISTIMLFIQYKCFNNHMNLYYFNKFYNNNYKIKKTYILNQIVDLYK